MKEYVPNLISVARIFMSVALFFLEPMGTPFIILYMMTFLSDILDGNLARRWDVCSDLGRSLDSIGDVVFMLAVLFVLVPWMHPDTWMLVLIAAAVLFRFTPAVIILVVTGKYNTFHTKWSKATTALVFFVPFIYLIIGQWAILIPTAFLILSGYYDYPLMMKFCKENSRY